VRHVQPILDSLFARFAKPHATDREVVLVQRRIFILPTRAGVVFAAVLLLMLVGSINYGLTLGLVLTFLLASFGITAMLHTFRNLAGLRATPVRAVSVFAGETAHFGVGLRNATRTPRFAIRLTCAKREADVVDIPGESSAVLTVPVAAPARGLLSPGRLTLHTRFPVGLYHAWSYLDLDTQCIVYPKPAPPGLPLPLAATQPAAGARAPVAADDFAGLRTYQAGDPLRHIAWKAAARGQGLHTKQFHGAQGGDAWLSLDLLPERLDIETRISQLTRWVLDAHAARLRVGLRLPHTSVELGSGDRHRDRCLEALALFPAGRAGPSAGST
jgi:uncharacterized protein (DUF58 family)